MNLFASSCCILSLSFLVSCGSGKDVSVSSDCQEISSSMSDPEHLSNYDVSKMSIDGNCLTLTGYISGCSEGESELIWTGISTRSMPPQIVVELAVYNAGDCDMIHEKEWKFSLSKLSSETIIRLKNHDFEVTYTP